MENLNNSRFSLPNKCIFILTNTLKTGGAEKQSIYLYNSLRKIYNTRLIVYYGDQLDARMVNLLPDKTDKNILYLNGSHLQKLRYLYKLFKSNADSVCISYLATTNTINALIGKLTGINIRIGGIRSSELTPWKRIVQRHLHNYWLTSSIFNNYQGLDKLVLCGFKRLKSVVIHNAIELPEIIKMKNEKLTVISVGRFVEAKDYETSLKAIKIVREKVADFRYVIVGQGKLEHELRANIEELELKECVEMIINPDNVNHYYRSSDIYLSTSVFEGLSNSIMEAMSFGLPVVATDIGDNKYLVKDGETGFLTKVKDADAVAAKLELLLNNEELRNTMGKKGRQHITENFSIEKFTQQYIELIEMLSNEK